MIATTLEQSKKLAEILPLDSADMYYHNISIRGVNYVDEHQLEAKPHIFPELTESKDERIRKELIHQFTTLGSSWDMWGGMKRTEIIAWLEK